MKQGFDYDNVKSVEFGVCRDVDDGDAFFLVPVDNDVKQVLQDMLEATKSKVHSDGEPQHYQPAEKYSSTEQLKLPLVNEMVILQQAEQNSRALEQDIDFVDFDSIVHYVSSHKRAARLVASLRTRDDLNKISKEHLKKLCKATKVSIQNSNGKMCPEAGHEYLFLQVLDRRRYNVTLIEDSDETYVAASRRRAR